MPVASQPLLRQRRDSHLKTCITAAIEGDRESQSLLRQRRDSHSVNQQEYATNKLTSQSLLRQRRDSHDERGNHVHQQGQVSIASSSAKGFESAGARCQVSGARLRIPPAAPNKPGMRARSPAADSASGTPQVTGLQPSAYSRQPAFPIASSSAKGSPWKWLNVIRAVCGLRSQSLLRQRRDSHCRIWKRLGALYIALGFPQPPDLGPCGRKEITDADMVILAQAPRFQSSSPFPQSGAPNGSFSRLRQAAVVQWLAASAAGPGHGAQTITKPRSS